MTSLRKYFLQVLRDLRPEEDVSFSCSGIALQKNGDVDSSTRVDPAIEFRCLRLFKMISKHLEDDRHESRPTRI